MRGETSQTGPGQGDRKPDEPRRIPRTRQQSIPATSAKSPESEGPHTKDRDHRGGTQVVEYESQKHLSRPSMFQSQARDASVVLVVRRCEKHLLACPLSSLVMRPQKNISCSYCRASLFPCATEDVNLQLVRFWLSLPTREPKESARLASRRPFTPFQTRALQSLPNINWPSSSRNLDVFPSPSSHISPSRSSQTPRTSCPEDLHLQIFNPNATSNLIHSQFSAAVSRCSSTTAKEPAAGSREKTK